MRILIYLLPTPRPREGDMMRWNNKKLPQVAKTFKHTFVVFFLAALALAGAYAQTISVGMAAIPLFFQVQMPQEEILFPLVRLGYPAMLPPNRFLPMTGGRTSLRMRMADRPLTILYHFARKAKAS